VTRITLLQQPTAGARRLQVARQRALPDKWHYTGVDRGHRPFSFSARYRLQPRPRAAASQTLPTRHTPTLRQQSAVYRAVSDANKVIIKAKSNDTNAMSCLQCQRHNCSAEPRSRDISI